MSQDTAILSVSGLTKHFPVSSTMLSKKQSGVVRAVDGIDFSVERGATLALVGESGCGKTTTSRMILRLDEPTKGRVEFDGQDVFSLSKPELRRYRTRVQAVFQDPWSSLNPRIRIRDIVAEPLVVNSSLSRQQIRERVIEALLTVGLRAEHAKSYAHEFSGGQRQRIAIAAALVSDPDLIVLDEPVSGLDVSIRSQIMNLFKKIQREHSVSYILVAHDLGTTRYMADRIAVMYLGKIVEYGDTETVFRAPKHPYTQALLSAALPARIDAERQEIVLRGEIPSPLNPPNGCPFHTRCPVSLGQRCETEHPKLQALDNGRVAACHRLD